jgi:hypothetical protein
MARTTQTGAIMDADQEKELRKIRLGEDGEELLLAKYRELYWYHNELQTIMPDVPRGNRKSAKLEIWKVSDRLRTIEKVLGYVPAP